MRLQGVMAYDRKWIAIQADFLFNHLSAVTPAQAGGIDGENGVRVKNKGD